MKVTILISTTVLIMLSWTIAVNAFKTSALSKFNQIPRSKLITRQAASLASIPVKLQGADKLLAKTDIFIFDCDGVIWYDIV